jgi:hypothetical protein
MILGIGTTGLLTALTLTTETVYAEGSGKSYTKLYCLQEMRV